MTLQDVNLIEKISPSNKRRQRMEEIVSNSKSKAVGFERVSFH